MTIVQWLLLILVIAVVAGVYWYLRLHSGGDPWQGMEDPVDEDNADDNGESLGGDSYIVGVRTLSKETPANRKASSGGEAPSMPDDPAELSDDDVEASWSAYKHGGSGHDESPAQRSSDSGAGDAPAPSANTGAARQAETASRLTPETPRAERADGIRPQRAPEGEQEVFILHVASLEGRFFQGPSIHAALQEQKLKFGLNDIYHRVTETHGVPESVFSVANMLKPGSLDPVAQDQLATPGLILFLVLPGPVEGVPAMRDMMETSNALAEELGGEVLDDKRARLKAQTAQYMLDQIAELDRRARLAGRR